MSVIDSSHLEVVFDGPETVSLHRCFLLFCFTVCGGWNRILLHYPGCPLTCSSCFGLLVIRITSAWHKLNIFFFLQNLNVDRGNWKPARITVCVVHSWIDYPSIMRWGFVLIFETRCHAGWSQTPNRAPYVLRVACVHIPKAGLTALNASSPASNVFFNSPENETVCTIKVS